MANSQLTRNRALVGGGFGATVRRIRVGAAPDGSEQASGLTLPARCVVLGAWVDVRVAEVTGTGKTMVIGPTSDPNGYLTAVDVSSVGVKNATVGALLPTTGAGDVTGAGENVVFTASNNDWVEFRGDIYVMYLNLSNK